ncbi:MAG: hypothetical protein ACI8QC_000582 [Planctomycetota bacterium]|jgi:hypothetical protein
MLTVIHTCRFPVLCALPLLLAAPESRVQDQSAPPRNYTIPVVDLSDQASFHTVVAKDIDKPNQYLGHPSTVLLDDRKTILARPVQKLGRPPRSPIIGTWRCVRRPGWARSRPFRGQGKVSAHFPHCHRWSEPTLQAYAARR